MYSKLRLILGDQLNIDHSWFKESNENVLYVLMEVREETDYTQHHIQKVTGIFAAMRKFNQIIESKGIKSIYLKLSDEKNKQSVPANLSALIGEFDIEEVEYQEPDEYRLDTLLEEWSKGIEIPVRKVSTEHFFTSREMVGELFRNKKAYLMETFYREMRKRTGLLMKGQEPEGGKWNYDPTNRKKLPKDHQPPPPLLFDHDLSDIVHMIREHGVSTLGNIDPEHYSWPIDREEALNLLKYFCEHLLLHFGDFQDALTSKSWTLYHSRLSFAMNLKLISPKEVCDAVESTFRASDEVDITQAEGFIRQILGWREFMRGIYWAEMPGFAEMNHFEHAAPLPSWYWNGKTKMACLRQAIQQSLDHGYAHHIQRLMVTGNFALLAGVDPDQVDHWYLGIYVDAYHWVEVTNTRGMSQYADGGLVGTKPYVSSASYLHKMGDHCVNCHYDHKDRTGERSCPLNSLYWHFHDRHRSKLESNPRISMMYKTWDKMDVQMKEELLQRGDWVLDHIEEL